jgi:hypothetical protein
MKVNKNYKINSNAFLQLSHSNYICFNMQIDNNKIIDNYNVYNNNVIIINIFNI